MTLPTCPAYDPSSATLSPAEFKIRWRELGEPACYAMEPDDGLRKLMFDGWLWQNRYRLPRVPAVDDSEKRFP